jgi:hypothetical protein
MADKKEEFVVSDRRRFAPEGDLRTDVPVTEEERTVSPPAAPSPAPPAPVAAEPEAPEEQKEELPLPPTAAEQQQQSAAYKASSKKMDDIFASLPGSKGGMPEMTFERLVEFFYVNALIQLGAGPHEGEPRVDILGARQMIDSISLIQEKTKGNLSDQEQNVLQSVLFELRMAWIEVTNAMASSSKGKAAAGGAPIIKK